MMAHNRPNAFGILLAGTLASLLLAECGARTSPTNKGDAKNQKLFVFKETFDSNKNWRFNGDYANSNFADYPGIKGWKHGTLSGQKHPKNRPYLNIVDGVVSGCSRGYGNKPQSFEPTIIHRPLDLDASQGFSLEFRAVSAAAWPNSVTVYLFSNWKPGVKKPKFYAFTIYGESSNHTIDLLTTSLDSFDTMLFRYKAGRMVNAWHTYRFDHSPDGAFHLFVDGKAVTNFNPPKDRTYKKFNHIALSPLRQGSKVDWIRIRAGAGAKGSTASSGSNSVSRPASAKGRIFTGDADEKGGTVRRRKAGWDGDFSTYVEADSNGNGLKAITWETTEVYRIPRGAANVRLHAKIERRHWQSHASVYAYDFKDEEYKLIIGGEKAGEGIVDKTVTLSPSFVKDGEIRVRALLFAKHRNEAYARYYETEVLYGK